MPASLATEVYGVAAQQNLEEQSTHQPLGSIHSKETLIQKTIVQSPPSNSNMTFLSGTGVFDWSQSLLMDDIVKSK